ncbi:YncE family protein [Nocardia sp. NPDC052001]|uniref:YncE family protein n=1 Tax=Nocardia sp. NPDC052001 TaxID=3154853 RepID=UPI0034197F3D
MTKKLLAVACQDKPSIVFLDPATNARLGEVVVPAEPHEMEYDTLRNHLYCAITYRDGFYEVHGDSGTEIAVIDVATRSLVRVIDLAPEHSPHGLYHDRDRDLLYVSVEAGPAGEGAVLAVDPSAGKIVERMPVGVSGPHWFAVTPDGAKAYVTGKEAPFVTVLDLATGQAVNHIEVPGSEGVAVHGRHAFVATPKLDLTGGTTRHQILVIDIGTEETVHAIDLAAPAVPVHVTTNGMLLTAEVHFEPGPRPLDGVLRAFDTTTFAPLGQAGLGQVPLTLISSADGARAYVANAASDTVTVVDLREHRPEATLTGLPGAHGLALVPAH